MYVYIYIESGLFVHVFIFQCLYWRGELEDLKVIAKTLLNSIFRISLELSKI
jgi:hypothetical protein